jgi:pectate lyase
MAAACSPRARLLVVSLVIVVAGACGASRVVPIRAHDASGVVPSDGGPSEPVVVADGTTDPAPAETVAPACAEPKLVGFATHEPGTSGGEGAGGRTMVVTSFDALVAAAALADKLTIDIGTMLEAPSGAAQVRVQSNKTIRGVAQGAGITGAGLQLFRVSNVVIQNLVLTRAATEDAITVNASTNVWIDHCELSMSADGLADVNHGANWVTMSWNHFHDQSFNSLVGHTAAPENVEDPGQLSVTYHHNWFHATEYYNPKVRYGTVHVFNNFYDYPEGSTATGVISQLGAKVLVEANVFLNLKTPIQTDSDDSKGDPAAQGFIAWGVDNKFTGTGNSNATRIVAWNPSPSDYSYALDDVKDVAALVSTCAGPHFK